MDVQYWETELATREEEYKHEEGEHDDEEETEERYTVLGCRRRRRLPRTLTLKRCVCRDMPVWGRRRKGIERNNVILSPCIWPKRLQDIFSLNGLCVQ